MSYHTHFYACDKKNQNAFAKHILSLYRGKLIEQYANIPDDDYFKKLYERNVAEVSDENIKKFREAAKKYEYPEDIVKENEVFFAKYKDPNYTWESSKKEWIERLDKIKATGILDFDKIPESELASFFIQHYDVLKYFDFYFTELYFEISDGKLYSGEIFKRFYSVKGRYCQSKWYNSGGVIEMIEDREGGTLSDKEKSEIVKFFKTYSDSYCWII